MRYMSMSQFKEKVFEITKRIKKGETLTYGEVARLAGKPGAARAVGAVLKTNYDTRIPCHRVVKADGTLGGYNRGVENKEKMLKKEKAI